MVSEIHTKQSTNEENSSLLMNSILCKAATNGKNLKSEKSQDYAQKRQRDCTFMNSDSGLVSSGYVLFRRVMKLAGLRKKKAKQHYILSRPWKTYQPVRQP
jgi:hypothetical protein